MQEQTTQRTSLDTSENERTSQQLQFTPFGSLSGAGVEHFHHDIKASLECHLKSVQIEKTVVKNCFILGAGKRENSLKYERTVLKISLAFLLGTSYSKYSFALLHKTCK